ncbi:PspC domain-containing protein [Flavobacteriaceae bacterium]|nr:PspC domain-containing protein [Flavobacteriaceae bacterium]
MNKTVNINLGGEFFHIDEDAFAELKRYLDAVRASLNQDESIEEIISDIESRIAELFVELLPNPKSVVTKSQITQVIDIMGQPEEFDTDEPADQEHQNRKATPKELYRDQDNKYIAGVGSGLGHYLGIDALWVRLIWLLLTIFSSGSFILIYILFWILVPAADSTSQKLKMKGQPINISNIERRFKEGYDNISDSVKSMDYNKYGDQVKKSSHRFFEAIAKALVIMAKIIGKIIGLILVVLSLGTILSMAIGFFSVGTIEFWGQGNLIDYLHAVNGYNAPIWVIFALIFVALGLPFLVLFIVGLKLLLPHLRSIGWTAKVIIFLIWLIALISLVIVGVQSMTRNAITGSFEREIPLQMTKQDTLILAMNKNYVARNDHRRQDDFKIRMIDEGQKSIINQDVRLVVRSTSKTEGFVQINAYADSHSLDDAQAKAQLIDYRISLSDNKLLIDPNWTTPIENKYRNQKIDVIVYLPTGSVFWADQNTHSYHQNAKRYQDILISGNEGHYLKVMDQEALCLDCKNDGLVIKSED